MSNISGDTMQDLINWLSEHEYEIESGENDFGELRQLFFELFDRNAGENIKVECMELAANIKRAGDDDVSDIISDCGSQAAYMANHFAN